jgi:hypothetical protein
MTSKRTTQSPRINDIVISNMFITTQLTIRNNVYKYRKLTVHLEAITTVVPSYGLQYWSAEKACDQLIEYFLF